MQTERVRVDDGFFAKHEHNLFEESVGIHVQNLAGTHEVWVNGRKIGAGGDALYRHKVPVGTLVKGAWNEIAINDYLAVTLSSIGLPWLLVVTRVLLRRVAWRILLREVDNPDHDHLRLLARQRNVPIEIRPDLPYSCVGLIRRLTDSEPGEA